MRVENNSFPDGLDSVSVSQNFANSKKLRMVYASPQLGYDDGRINNGMSNDTPESDEPPRQTAVRVKNAYKRYGSGPPILHNFNMTVPRGTIYGLLGASGCGKTTILSCIVGLKSLDSGEIWVYGAKPGTKESGIPGKTIGYMPQDIALYSKFSMEEVLYYFGGIYGMSKTSIADRIEFLVKFLDLPDCKRRIDTLSGGQQRRASLAVSMVHTPALLILDEPTVGVDPLIRESIWAYLTQLVAGHRTTVIITTHYIEEARASATVGLMRNGRLLAEQSPETLLRQHNAQLLEEIVLKLCKKDEDPLDRLYAQGYPASNGIFDSSFYAKVKKYFTKKDDVECLKYNSKVPEDEDDQILAAYRRSRAQSIRRRQSVIENINDSFARQADKVLALTKRNFLIIMRNPLLFIMLIIIPAFQVAIFNTIVAREPVNKRVGLVNNEFPKATLAFPDYCQNRTGCFTLEKDAMGLSCNYLKELGNKVIWETYDKAEDAAYSLRVGDSIGYVVIPNNFTEHMKNRVLEKNFASDETLQGSTLEFYLDYSAHLLKTFLIESFYSSYLAFVKNMAVECNQDPRFLDLPLNYSAIYGRVDFTTLEYMQPPQILLNLFLLPMAVSITYIWDKKAGTLDRTLVAGVDFIHVIISLLISEGVMIICEIALCLAVLFLVFNFHVTGSVLLVLLLTMITGICGLSFGFLIGVLCDHEIEAVMLILSCYLPTMTLSGAMWPLEGLPQSWARTIANIFPITLPSESLRSIVNRGWGFTHSHVWPGFGVVILYTVIACTLSYVFHRIRR